MDRARIAYGLAGFQCLLALVAGVALRDVGTWNTAIFIVLVVLALVGDRLEVEAHMARMSPSFLAIGLAMILLGPSAGAAVGLITTLVDSLRRRLAVPYALSNLASFTIYPIVGGVLADVAVSSYGLDHGDVNFAVVVTAVFVFVNAVNFQQIAVMRRIMLGESIVAATRKDFLPLLPSQIAVGALAGGIVYVYAHGGGAALVLFLGVVILYQYLLRELVLSRERAEQLGKRTTQLASLQVGVLTAMLQTLSLRDKMTARHCAAVARYSREIAREAGCDEQTQDLVHTAGLLHDIGKFIFPDRILIANTKLDDADWEIVKMHPAQGAKVVRQVEGYGPVADIILAHHEKIDGTGYPRGLRGDEIPLLARIISVADTYDVMTARDSYRDPVSPAKAIAELRRVSGAQLDGEIVELFIKMLERKGVGFHHGDDADFESELDLERRVREYAAGQMLPA